MNKEKRVVGQIQVLLRDRRIPSFRLKGDLSAILAYLEHNTHDYTSEFELRVYADILEGHALEIHGRYIIKPLSTEDLTSFV